MTTPHDPTLPDEGMIHEWLDGQLDADTSAQFDALVTRSPEFAARVAEARGLIAASSRILSALDDVPGDVLPRRNDTASAAATDRGVRSITEARPRGPTMAWQRWAGAAAVLLVAVSSTLLWQRAPTVSEPSARTDSTSERTAAVASAAAEPTRAIASAEPSAGPPASVADASVADADAAAAQGVAANAVARSAAARIAPAPSAPSAPSAPATSEVATASVLAESVADVARVGATAAAKAAPENARVRGGLASSAESPMRRSAEAAPAMAPVGAGMARSLSAASDASTELADMPGGLRPDELAFAVQRVECAPQCRQRRVEIARDGRLRRWTAALGRSTVPDTGHLTPVAVAELVALADSLALETLPAVVPLMGAQCRSVGSLRESLRLEFRSGGQSRAVTALPWCDAPDHPLAIMARAVERVSDQQLGAPSR